MPLLDCPLAVRCLLEQVWDAHDGLWLNKTGRQRKLHRPLPQQRIVIQFKMCVLSAISQLFLPFL